VGRKSDDLIVAKSKEMKTRTNVAEISKEDYGSNSAILPMMMVNEDPIHFGSRFFQFMTKIPDHCGVHAASTQ
jgi:hypothetical protein